LSLPFDFLDKRRIVIALAGSNGTCKSTDYESFLADAGLRFVKLDERNHLMAACPSLTAEKVRLSILFSLEC